MTLLALALFLPGLFLIQANAVVFAADRLTARLEDVPARTVAQPGAGR